LLHNAVNFGKRLGLSSSHSSALAKLRTPAKIQEYVAKIPTNFELGGETNQSVVQVMKTRKAHCLEGAFVAACALWMQGHPPLLMNLRAIGDDDHAVTLFRHGKHWGAISKSNHIWLRWRDPIYRNLRELALTYFHEYVNGPNKTMDGYSSAFDLRRFKPSAWVASPHGAWGVAEALAATRHFKIIDNKAALRLRPRDSLELRVGKILEHPAPNKKLMSRY